nr:uncharacterized protein LOC113808996 isoform X1 [Penaeus vannamei]XP_027216279.1 uncharacterized protein LOC113808996 isoform X2 [Penaeus vannamei]
MAPRPPVPLGAWLSLEPHLQRPTLRARVPSCVRHAPRGLPGLLGLLRPGLPRRSVQGRLQARYPGHHPLEDHRSDLFAMHATDFPSQMLAIAASSSEAVVT